MIVYNKLWLMLNEKGMKRTDLLEVISAPTLAKLGKNENVSIDVITKICDFLKCQPGDIMENITKEDLNKTAEIVSEQMNAMVNKITAVTGLTKEQMIEELAKGMPMFIEALKQDKIDALYGLREEDTHKTE